MEINLEGVNKEFQEITEKFLREMVKFVFNNQQVNIRKISIPIDLIEIINQLHNEEHAQDYVKSEYGELFGKCYNKNGISDIYLNNIVYNNLIYSEEIINHLKANSLVDELQTKCMKSIGYTQYKIFYHELMHIKNYNDYYPIYKDFKGYEYPIDVDVFQQAFSLWDEYLAVKRTALMYFDERDLSDLDEFYNIISSEYDLKLKKIKLYANEANWKEIFITSVLYVDEIRRYLSYTLGILDGLEEINTTNKIVGFESYKDNYIDVIKENCMGSVFIDIWEMLKNNNDIIQEDEIINIGNCIKRIYTDYLNVDWLRENSNSNPYYVGLLK